MVRWLKQALVDERLERSTVNLASEVEAEQAHLRQRRVPSCFSGDPQLPTLAYVLKRVVFICEMESPCKSEGFGSKGRVGS
jgi:hypothetical protein